MWTSRFRWVSYIAGRHFRTRRRERGHTAFVLSVAGIAVGVMTLIVVLAVMNGFQLGTIEDILEVNSYHLRVRGLEEAELVREVEGLRNVESVVPFTEAEVLGGGSYADSLGIRLRGVPPDIRELDRGFAEHVQLIAGEMALQRERAVVIGAELAARLGIGVGDTVNVINLSGESLDVRSPRRVELRVVGVFRTGFLDYDRSWGFVGLESARTLFGADLDPVLGVKLQDRFRDQSAAQRIEALAERHTGVSNLSVESWRSYNRAIFGALRLEKTLMTVLIGLIFIVVGANIYQSLRRSVTERVEEIALLKSLGAAPRDVQLVFVMEGLLTGFVGGTLGTLLGLAVSVHVNALFAAAETVINGVAALFAQLSGAGARTAEIFSTRHFYIQEVPTELVFSEVLGIFLFAWVSAIAAAALASRAVAGIRPAEVLRDE
jgi:lipoprotein-releasing system permease protein